MKKATSRTTPMGTNRERLGSVLAALRIEHRPARLRRLLRDQGAGWVTQTYDTLDATAQSEVDAEVEDLAGRDVCVTWLGDEFYPAGLTVLDKAPAILFTIGNIDLLTAPSIGMCGSRHASELGLAAARNCGETVADCGLAIVSGYAKGVDTETHLAALRSDGSTVIVLAEGIRHFRKKRDFAGVGLEPARVLVVSQFPPSQRWNVGAAMTRNGVIAGLGRALIVIEAGETGGTLNAGLQALEVGRPVLALEFESQPTPAGNVQLIERGALPVRNSKQLTELMSRMRAPTTAAPNPVEQQVLL